MLKRHENVVYRLTTLGLLFPASVKMTLNRYL